MGSSGYRRLKPLRVPRRAEPRAYPSVEAGGAPHKPQPGQDGADAAGHLRVWCRDREEDKLPWYAMASGLPDGADRGAEQYLNTHHIPQ